MSKQIEALKLALEALEDLGMKHYESTGEVLYKDTFTAIKEALAQPEQDGKCKYCTDGCPACDARKLPEQEPFMASYEFKQYGYYKDGKGTLKLGNIPATQQSQRTWVGLTKEERHEISMANRPYCADIMAAHEEELKRRNT